MSFLKYDISWFSPSSSKNKKGRSAMSSTTLIRQTETDLRNFERSKDSTPFGHYKNQSCALTGSGSENDKTLLGNIVEEIVKKHLQEYKLQIIEDITQKSFSSHEKDLNCLKEEVDNKYSEISKRMDEITEILKKKPNLPEKAAENTKDFQKCLSYRSENIDNDIEENTNNSNNEIKFLEKNMNNLRWKDSTKKCEGIFLNSESKKNSASFGDEYLILLEEVGKIKQRLENFEKKQEILSYNNNNLTVFKEANLNSIYNNTTMNDRTFESGIKCKKQESLETYHQQTPSFDNEKTDFRFTLAPTINNITNSKNSKTPLLKDDTPKLSDCSQTFKDSMDLCNILEQKTNNNDYSPALSENNKPHVETFHEKYLIDKIKLIENPLNDDYFKKKKSVNDYQALVLREEDIKLRLSYGQKGLDDFDVNYDKDGFVPLFNFNSNKSHLSKKEKEPPKESKMANNKEFLDNDVVEMGTNNTNETKSLNNESEEAKEIQFTGFDERENLLKRDRYEIKEANSREEGDDNDVIIYHLDENNCLIDENGLPIFDSDEKKVTISVENMDFLRRSYYIEKD